jgi:hypothetical protein
MCLKTNCHQRSKHHPLRRYSIVFMLCLAILILFLSYFIFFVPLQVDIARTTAQLIAACVNSYMVDTHLIFSKDNFDLKDLLLKSTVEGEVNGPYLEADLLNDAWGNPYTIQFDPKHKFKYDIISWGRDGKPNIKDDLVLTYDAALVSPRLSGL